MLLKELLRGKPSVEKARKAMPTVELRSYHQDVLRLFGSIFAVVSFSFLAYLGIRYIGRIAADECGSSDGET